MKPTLKQWQEIERLYQASVGLPLEERTRFLAEACADQNIRREVESLLIHRDQGLSLVDRAAVDVAAEMVSGSHTQLLVGRTLGPYHVRALIGAGGMGVVYRAHDTRLGRDVALKVLPQEFFNDPGHLIRSEREGRVLASLNHPNIAGIHDLIESQAVRCLVLEFVAGETLSQLLNRSEIPLFQALNICRQIAEALHAAHEQGIVHRDLKPGNVMITLDGSVKVVDFGIAKMFTAGAASSPTSQGSPDTRAVNTTQTGAIVGTAAYMSPEQARGLAVDKRTDIWAFGCVLYEVLTGRAPFSAPTFSDTIAAIRERDPDWTALPTMTPTRVRQLLVRCLEKRHEERLRDLGDARIELREALEEIAPKKQPTHAVSGRTTREWPRRWMWGSVAAVTGGLLVAGALVLRRPSSAEDQIRLSLAFEGLTNDGATPVPSPDGKTFVFQAVDASGKRSLWLRPLDAETARAIPRTDDAEQPFWFPDGRSVGFYAEGQLRRVNLANGGVQTIAGIKQFARGFANGAAANALGDVIFSAGNRSPLFRVRGSDGAMQQLTQLDSSRAENSHRFPVFLPDGRHFLFIARSSRPENDALVLGSLDAGSLDTTEIRRIMPVHSNVSYVAARKGRAGMLLYVRNGTLVEQPFDGTSVSGEPIAIADNVEYEAPSLLGRFGVSANGTVLILRRGGAGRTRFQWFDRKGNSLAFLGPPGAYSQPRISPDGSRVLFSRPDAQTGNRDVWYMETSAGVATRLTTHQANDWWPVWSPDGLSILFGTDREGGPLMATYRKTGLAPGAHESKLVEFQGPQGSQAIPQDWSLDGRWIALQSGAGSSADADVWILPTTGESRPFAFISTRFAEHSPRFSPDGRWIAYVSNESGRYEVYVRPFLGAPSTLDTTIPISTMGGDFVVWQRDGRELFFIGSDLRLYSVSTTNLHAGKSVSQPNPLFTPCAGTSLAGLPMQGMFWDHPYDVSLDGQQFLFNCSASSPSRFDVVLNLMEHSK